MVTQHEIKKALESVREKLQNEIRHWCTLNDVEFYFGENGIDKFNMYLSNNTMIDTTKFVVTKRVKIGAGHYDIPVDLHHTTQTIKQLLDDFNSCRYEELPRDIKYINPEG